MESQITSAYCAQLHAWLSAYQARSAQESRSFEARQAAMHSVNPRYVLRNYIAQLAIDEVEKGDFSMVSTLLDVLRNPYKDQPEHDHFAERRPDWARQRAGCSMLSCSS